MACQIKILFKALVINAINAYLARMHQLYYSDQQMEAASDEVYENLRRASGDL